MDPTIALEDVIRKAQVKKETIVAVYFDMEKAYDMMWKKGLLVKLFQLGIKRRILQWVKNFLPDRKIKVRINGVFSNEYEVEIGTPQGSIVSPLLFTVLMNDVFKDIDNSRCIICR